MYWIGLGKIRTSLDSVGEQGVSKLKIAVILGLVGVIIGWIPLIGGIIGGILAILAFVFEFMGYGLLKGSNAIGNEEMCIRDSITVVCIGQIAVILKRCPSK